MPYALCPMPYALCPGATNLPGKGDTAFNSQLLVPERFGDWTIEFAPALGCQ